MKSAFFAILIAVLLANPSTTIAETTLGSDSLTLGGGEKLNITKYLDEKGVGIRAATADGTKICEFGEMGSEDKLFTIDAKATGLAVKDITGDGVAEIITAAFYGPTASGLYVFNYDAASKKLVPVKFLNSDDPELSTDFMVSDVRQENNQDMTVEADGTLQAVGKIYPEDAGSEPVTGLYKFKYADGSFKLSEKKPLPAAE